MITKWNESRPVPVTEAGCVIDAPAHTGFGFARNRAARTFGGIIPKIAIAAGSFALAGAAALGLIQAGYAEHTATGVTLAAGKVSVAATVAAYAVSDRRRRQFLHAARRPVPAPDERIPPPATATAGDLPGGAN